MQALPRDNRFEELCRENEKLERLCRLTADIARLGNERATLKRIVDSAANLIGVQSAHIALEDKNGEQLYGVVSSGRHPQEAPRLRFQLSQSAAAQAALKSRKPVAIENAEDDARVNPDARDRMGIRGVAYLPLLGGNASFGLLILITRRPHAWTSRELEFAMRFADVASVALENSHLMAQLAETEVRFRSLLEHIPVILYRCDVEPPFQTRYISPQVTAMLGYSVDEWIQKPNLWIKSIHPDDVDAVVEEARRAIDKGGFGASEYRLLDHWGEVRWFRDEAILLRDPSGTPIAWQGVLVEITGIKKPQQ